MLNLPQCHRVSGQCYCDAGLGWSIWPACQFGQEELDFLVSVALVTGLLLAASQFHVASAWLDEVAIQRPAGVVGSKDQSGLLLSHLDELAKLHIHQAQVWEGLHTALMVVNCHHNHQGLQWGLLWFLGFLLSRGCRRGNGQSAKFHPLEKRKHLRAIVWSGHGTNSFGS